MAEDFLTTIENEAVRTKVAEVATANGLNHRLAYLVVQSGLDGATGILAEGIKQHNAVAGKVKAEKETNEKLEALTKELTDCKDVRRRIALKRQISELQNKL